jgi:nicotinate-nucleotide--dimethylbenzimidazole phosphoribosyltransferase
MTFPSSAIAAIDNKAGEQARARQGQLTKPTGALGQLESLAVTLAGIQRSETPTAAQAAAIIFASDHPVASLGVSAYPQEVTSAMLANFVRGGAAASVLARLHGAALHVVDVGVLRPYSGQAKAGATYTREAVADHACGNMVDADAMSKATFDAAFQAGRAAVDRLSDSTNLIVLGEMGIGNTTCAAAVTCALLGLAAADVTGIGTGVAGPALTQKRDVVAKAASRAAAGTDPAEILRICGGRELAAIAGAAIRAAERGMAVVVDGFIVTAAIACAVKAVPALRPYLIFAHRSSERGHSALLSSMDAKPLLDLELRLGEASGGLLALPVIAAACALHNQMATFAEASVPDKE